MFTGIITDTGTIKKRTARGLEIDPGAHIARQLKTGDSVSVNGACLTVASKNARTIRADVMEETWKKTMLGKLKSAQIVNLELPLKIGSLISGHFVQGHIDGVAKIISIKKDGAGAALALEAPAEIARYLVDKGSIAIDGVSLTIVKSNKKKFSVGIIPHTWNNTMLCTLKAGDLVNVEIDILAKYAKKLLKS